MESLGRERRCAVTKRVRPDPEAERLQLGERLRRAREYLGLSQDEVARHLGIPRTALSNIEAGSRRVEVLELKRLADLFRQPVTHFTAEEDEDTAGAAELPADIAHLARAATKLSTTDREELRRFAEYLRVRSVKDKRK
jgi:transcriptional regulator with XRE-family HTH domain